MNNPIKSQIAANRERFIGKYYYELAKYLGGNLYQEILKEPDKIGTSLLQTAIAAVEEMKVKNSFVKPESHRDFSAYVNYMHEESGVIKFNAALSKVVELLKGGIDN